MQENLKPSTCTIVHPLLSTGHSSF